MHVVVQYDCQASLGHIGTRAILPSHMSVLPCELAGKWKFSLSIGRSVAKKSFLSYGDIEYRVGVVFLCCV